MARVFRRVAVAALAVALATVATVAVEAANKDYLFVGGSFSQVSNGVGRGNGMGSLYDGTKWQSLHQTLNTGGFFASAVYKNELYVAGQFTKLSSSYLGYVLDPIYNIAKFNTTSAFYSHIGNGGRAPGTAVYALTVANNVLYVGGSIGSLDGVSASGIAAWNGTHASALGSGVGGVVYAIAQYNGALFVAGDISPLNHVALWNATAGTWSTVGGGAQYISYALAVFNGLLYLGGDFTSTGTVANYYLGAWNGTAWLQMPRVGYVNSQGGVRTFYVDGDTLFMGGGFTSIGGVTVNRIASTTNGYNWTVVGGVDGDGRGISQVAAAAYGTAADVGTVRAITRYQGLLYVGGDFHFTVAYGRTADWMVRYNTTRQSWAIAPAGILDGQVRTFVPFTAPVYPCDSIANCLFTNPNTTAFSSILLDESGAYQWVYSYLDLNTATAFIPTNAAFSTIASDGTVNGYDLNTVLSYHIVWKSYVAGAVGYTTFFETLLTDSRYVSGSPGGLPNQNVGMNKSSDGSLTVFGGGLVDAKVLVPNLASTNGYYNIVDRFFTIPDTLPVMLARYGLTEFSAALTQSGLMANITALKLVTVMAPTNAAFASSYPAWRTIPNARLLEMLKAHIVPNTVWYMAPGKVWNGVSMPTLLGSVLYIGNENRQYNYFDGTVGTTTTSVKINLFLRNGALHIVDKALARATSVVYTTAITPNSSVPVAQLDNDNISISKDCTVQRSGTVYGGWTVSYNGNKMCCVTRGVMSDNTMLTGCDSGTVATDGIYSALGSTKGYSACYNGDVWLNMGDALKSGTASRAVLDASSSFGNNATAVKRSAALMSSNLQDGAYKFSVASGSRRTTTTNVYCTGKGIIVVADNGDKSCQLNVCGQTTPHFLAVDLASATAGTKCFHTCFR